MLTSSDVGDLQQKYLSMDAAMPRKSEARHGPAFRALVRGLDETDGKLTWFPILVVDCRALA